MATTRKNDTRKNTKPVEKTPARRAVQRKPAAKKAAATPSQRFQMIQEHAYLLAERDGYKGHPDAYWFAAEREVNVLLGTVSAQGGGSGI